MAALRGGMDEDRPAELPAAISPAATCATPVTRCRFARVAGWRRRCALLARGWGPRCSRRRCATDGLPPRVGRATPSKPGWTSTRAVSGSGTNRTPRPLPTRRQSRSCTEVPPCAAGPSKTGGGGPQHSCCPGACINRPQRSPTRCQSRGLISQIRLMRHAQPHPPARGQRRHCRGSVIWLPSTGPAARAPGRSSGVCRRQAQPLTRTCPLHAVVC